MKRLLFAFVAALAVGLTLASIALPVLADEPVYENITLTDTDDNTVDFDAYPGLIGINGGTTNPVLVATDANGNIEMLCVEINADVAEGIRKEESRLSASIKPSIVKTVLTLSSDVNLQPDRAALDSH